MQRPTSIGAFQFVVLASLRAAQLTRGCRARADGDHKHTVMAQMEVAQGKVVQQLVLLGQTATPLILRDLPDELLAVPAR
jgi:hypothetical protein